MVLVTILSQLPAAHAKDASDAQDVRDFLKNYLKVDDSFLDKTSRYSFEETVLHDGKQSIVVYITGNAWCGSGGCTAIILQPDDKSFKVINKLTLVRLPVRILPTKTHGWHDLAVPVRAGKAGLNRVALLKFNGQKYPANPSTAPSAKSGDIAQGKILLLKERGDLVY